MIRNIHLVCICFLFFFIISTKWYSSFLVVAAFFLHLIYIIINFTKTKQKKKNKKNRINCLNCLSKQVNIDIEDVNDNPPEFESTTVRISVPENVELGTPLYAANARDKDSGKSGIVRYRLTAIDGGSNRDGSSTTSTSSSSSTIVSGSTNPNLFTIDSQSGHLTLLRHLDYESAQRHTLIVTATDMGEPSLQANLTILVEVQDVNDNPPVFEQNEYSVNVLESMPINSQVWK